MMRATAVILCEDKQSQVVLWRYAKARGFQSIRALPLAGSCGSQYVRESYAREVRSRRVKHVAQVLLVHIDADQFTVQERHRELADQLKLNEVEPRTQDEPVALVVPRREMETWLHHYRGKEGIVETVAYPRFRGEEADAAKPTVDALVAMVTGKQEPPKNLPAITEAVSELRRLEMA